MYYVYILECGDGTLYTGITTDVGRRYKEHKSGKGAAYTKSRGANKILYIKKHKNRSTASKHEARIKKMTREKKIELINLYEITVRGAYSKAMRIPSRVRSR